MVLPADPGVRDELLTLSEAASLARVQRETVRAWCVAGRLPSVPAGGGRERRIRRADLERVVAEAHHPIVLRERRSVAPEPERSDAGGDSPTSAASHEALRRLTAGLSGTTDVDLLFGEVLDDSIGLFGADRAGLWLWRPHREFPLELVGAREMPDEIVEYVQGMAASTETAGLHAVRGGRVTVFRVAEDPSLGASVRTMLLQHGVSTVCLVPAVFRGEPQGVIALLHRAPYDWSADALALAGSFADGLATALGTARLVESVNALAARLHAVQDLAARLNGLTDLQGIGEAIVTEADSLLPSDTIRVYKVDERTATCEPIAFRGVFMGTASPTTEMLRVKVGDGLTGWVAKHNVPLLVGDARVDPRSATQDAADGPESVLLVPLSIDGQVGGVVVLSRLGRDRFTPDDQATLTIFAGYAIQAFVNVERLTQVHLQQAELAHQLTSQRRLLAVNERLLSTLDPSGVLDLIADSLKTVVIYDSLTIYRVDAERGVRRPVIARDRFAELILGYEAPLGSGITGWVVEHREAVLANDALNDPRAIQIPGTPADPESMIIVPLIAEGGVLGTLNIARMGGVEAYFSENEFELTKLFAAQAAIALRNADAHGEVKVQAERDALTGLRNHGAFQRELGAAVDAAGDRPFSILMMDLDRFKAFNDTRGHPAGDQLLAQVARAIESSIRSADRAYRYGGDEFAVILPDSGRLGAEEVAERIRSGVETLQQKGTGPTVSISIGIAAFPGDGAVKDTLVENADAALYLAKGSRLRSGARDPLVAALDATAGVVLDGGSAETVLETILTRASRLLGTPHAYIYLVEDPGIVDGPATHLVVRAGLGQFEDAVGFRISVDSGLAGAVYRTGQPLVVDDYDTFSDRVARFEGGTVGATVGIPLRAHGQIIGVIGLATGPGDRHWHEPEVDALHRFAQLASIALENARLQRAAERGPTDPVTGLPTRERLLEAIDAALDGTRSGAEGLDDVGAILLDVDRFRIINESLGHAAGDRVLEEVGRRIAATLGPEDVVGRFGGDEFGILVRPATGERAGLLAERIQLELKAPLDLDGRIWFISATMGYAVGRPGSTTAGDLLREAEVALIQAQEDPVIRITQFDPIRSREALERLDLEGELRAGIARGELLVHYQPIIDLRTERIVGFEALVRWDHPTRGLIYPNAFISLAEKTDLIVPLGAVVLEEACRQARAWRTAWPGERLVMSVNLSPRQFADPGLVASIAATHSETGLEPSALELEITETAVMDQSEPGMRALADLRALGVRLVLDDFGTGYSSLAYLRNMPLDTIKVDRSFVTELDDVDPNVAIVQAVLSLAHGLGINVVAEGIETAEQAARLRELGCDLGQGYNWSRPLSAVDAAALMARSPVQRRLPVNRSRNRNRLTKSR